MTTARLSAIAAGFAVVLAGIAVAQPSEYFQWQNKKTNQKMCEPQSPGADWVKLSGPYEDPNCSIPIKP